MGTLSWILIIGGVVLLVAMLILRSKQAKQ